MGHDDWAEPALAALPGDVETEDLGSLDAE
ncbi:MAG: hypothetical protein J07HB67_02607 [halophilic archaeon J07HB67]|nr:MAG: hypothetical protein J07HB67_02607 [halophilic archaeon J07HB67]